MADRKITYSLNFIADTENVKTQLDQVGHSLQAIASYKLIDDKQFNEAADAALRMKGHLDKALDPNTGKLDLTRLYTSMKNAGDSAQSLRLKFSQVGAEGNRAFLQVANAVANAQPSIIRTSKLMNNLWISLKNTAKWQISSAVLGSFTNSLSTAVSFAKELNKSLNDIRIVSGDSADEMARFAKEANKMAKEIGTSTTDITKGTLIYRQQGDTAAEAAQKAEITAKAAAITTESTAEEMSEYLTGIWNSYQVGSDELELFVDKLAYVGATTATSMEEIATSMTKVAATANSVGVGYEQLLGVIATVSSATRVSAEQVGTAYKTILARMGDLKLEGSIEEDGITVSLGSVSSTLKQIGIDVLDSNDNMRDMGLVIEEVGSQWDNFTRAEQAAIAEALAGKRQYTQLFALFDNWEEYEKNVKGAADAQGTLNEQHQIYLESWNAASNQIKTNLEKITMSMYSDESILTLMNGFAKVLELIGSIIEGMGGFGPLLLMIGSIATRVFRTQIGAGLENIWTNLLILSGKSKKVTSEIEAQFSATAKTLAAEMSGGYAQVEAAQSDYLVSLFDFQNKYSQSYSKMRDETRQLIELEKQRKMQGFAEATEKISIGQSGLSELSGKKVDFRNVFSPTSIQFLAEEYKKAGISFDVAAIDLQEFGQVASQSSKPIENFKNIINELHRKMVLGDDERENFIADIQRIRDGSGQIRGITGEFNAFGEKIKDLEDSSLKTTEKITQLSSVVMALGSIISSTSSMWDTLIDKSSTTGEKMSSLTTTLPMVALAMVQVAQAAKALNIALSGGWSAVIGIALVAIPGIIKGINYIAQKEERMIEDSKQAAEEYEKTKQELDETNNILDEKKKKLDEINKLKKTSKNTNEIKVLESEIRLLEQKKKIQERLEKEKAKNKEKKADIAVNQIIENFNSDYEETDLYVSKNAPTSSYDWDIYSGEIEKRYEFLKSAMYDENGAVSKLLAEFDNASEERQQEILDTIEQIESEYADAASDYNNLQIVNEEDYEWVSDKYNAYIKLVEKSKKATDKDTKSKEEQAKAEAKWEDSISSTVDILKNYDNMFDTVSKAMEEFQNEGHLSYNTIVALKEEFDTNEELEEFYEGLANGTVTMEEFRKKTGELIAQELTDKILKGELNGLNKEMMTSWLKSKNVVNAAAVTQDAYNMALVKNKLSTMTVVKRNGQLSKSFLTLAASSGYSTQELGALKAQEILLNNQKLDLKDQVNQIISIGNACGWSTGMVAGLEDMLANMATIKVGDNEVSYLKSSYLKGQGYKLKSAGDNTKSAYDNTWISPISGEVVTTQEAAQEIQQQTIKSFMPKIELPNVSVPSTNTGDGGSSEPKPIDWTSIRLREIKAETTQEHENTMELYQNELDALDEEKGEIDKIIQKNNDILWEHRQLQKSYQRRITEQEGLLDILANKYGYDVKDILTWYDNEGEQSRVFGTLLESLGGDTEKRESLEEAWDDIKKVIDAIKESKEELDDLKLEEPGLIDNLYESRITKYDQYIEELEYANERLEDSASMDYDALRKNYAAIQEYYKSQYNIAKQAGREKEAREYIAKWWQIESEIVSSISDEYDEAREAYDAIAEELIRREEESIEKLDELIERYDKQIERLQYSNTLQQEYNTTINNILATQHAIDKELRNSMLSEKYLSEKEKEKIFNAKDYLIITKEISEIQEEIDKNYIKYQREINKLGEDELYRANLLTKEFQAQTAEKQRALEILKMEIDLTKKRNALSEALEEKNVRIFQAGRWTQVANFQAVQSAADALAETEYQISEKKRQNAQAAEQTENELRIAEIEERKGNLEALKEVHEKEIERINDITEVLDDAKTKWETGFDRTAVKANDLADAFRDAKAKLESEFASSYSKVRKTGTSYNKLLPSAERSDLQNIYNAKTVYESNISEFHSQHASYEANKIRENSSSDIVKSTVNMSALDMKKKFGFADGTKDTPAGVARVNEKGLELYGTSSGQFIELNPHGKIFNNEQFNYLYTLSRGKTSLDARNQNSRSLSIGQMNLTLPNVTNTQSFVEGLKHLNDYIKNTKNL